MEEVREKLIKSLKEVVGVEEIELDFPENLDYGDYSANVAMQLWPKLPITNCQFSKKEVQSPKKLAEKMVGKLREDEELAKVVSKIEVAGSGFINFWLREEVLEEELEKAVDSKIKYGSSDKGKGKIVLVDYSSPNIAKSFSIGHLRSTIIGQAIYNLYEYLGFKVIGDNHLGDWGTQFGTLLYQITSKGLDKDKLTLEELEELYVEFNTEAEENPKLWDEARAWFKKLEDGDKEARDIWESAVRISLEEFNRLYEKLGVDIDNVYGESFYEDKMLQVLSEIREKGFSKKSEGAEIVEFGDIPPGMLVKSDGATTYLTRDLATIKYRIEKWDPFRLIYEVGSEQTLHFRQLFRIAEMMGWVKDQELVHVAHGLIRFETGKMSTRKGKTVKLEEVLTESIDRAKKIIVGTETDRGLSADEVEKISEIVGIGAIKYFDLLHHPASDIVFDWEKMFQMEGNSGPYLQYTFARTQSVLRNVKTQKSTPEGGQAKVPPLPRLRGASKTKTKNLKLGDAELVVVRYLIRFPEVVSMAANAYSPNLICNFLYGLAQKYNSFYNGNRIIGGENEEMRLVLTEAVGNVLESGLRLLGIKAPEKM